MNTQVIAVSSHDPTEAYYRLDAFKSSLSRLNVSPIILGINEGWDGLMTKPLRFRNYLRDGGCKYERAILCDCWDVIFTEHPDSIVERCTRLYGDAIVFNTEKSCWPLSELAPLFPDRGTPWKYLNGGVMCGPTKALLQMFENMNIEEIGFDRVEADGVRIEPNDAVPLVNAYVSQAVPVDVDSKCEVFQSFSECAEDEFEITPSGAKNKLTGTTPGILHFNGDAKNRIMPKVISAMGL